MALCRDPKTAGTWAPVTEICQASRVGQAEAENQSENPTQHRGSVIYTKQTTAGADPA